MTESNSITKVCTQCPGEKPLSEFGDHNIAKDGLRYCCKLCNRSNATKYQRTKDGVITQALGHQKAVSKQRGHKPPIYTKEELKNWLYSQELFHDLFNNWVNSGYDKWLKPSIDRLDDYKGYSFNNLRLVTWAENDKRGRDDRKGGVNNKVSKAVVQINADGTFVAEFHSHHHASRITGINRGNISSCCSGRYKTAGGYRWMYSLGIPIANNLIGERK